jgi:hypothetical protein
MLSSDAIVNLHDRQTRAWHLDSYLVPALRDEVAPVCCEAGSVAGSEAESAWLAAVDRQHRANFDLWHIEDEARAPGATDAELAGVKRRVDLTNQRRNDLTEELDRALLAWLVVKGLPNDESPLHSESPGLIVDRLSILALKIYHTREEAERADAPPGHAGRNRERLAILELQRADLAGCLDDLWRQTLEGTRRFKLYRQLKMYNDPALNPAIYRKTLAELRKTLTERADNPHSPSCPLT